MAESPTRAGEALGADNPFSQVSVEIMVSVGTARPSIRDLLSLKPDAILHLDRKVNDPVELFIGDKLIARGELEEREGSPEAELVVRLTEVADLKNGI
ncbi:FliM/FliN family flagellar motor C-terminal domain-containing protein [Maritimibacter sp. HL-12]|uniref:FliM/FliN family flagellar motor switch protein n=1 Tax=Maritimibacter sp. HL-12 TaxID=1162418 RepID=UPI000A0EEB8F|nr:FliM/FliN family flagellar motor C-terminal domain-containing protein [Maritimibacter sp. HL-12]SMH43090.1 flagellar motor switch protein FliN/FliY [Maritimibacter sp. HL-12]